MNAESEAEFRDALCAALAAPDELAEAVTLLKRTERFLRARGHDDGDLHADIDAYLKRQEQTDGE